MLLYPKGDGVVTERSVGMKGEAHHHRLSCLGLTLVEDEVAQAVEYQRMPNGINGLQYMGVMTDDGIGSRLSQASSHPALPD